MAKGQLGLMIYPADLDNDAFRAAWETWLEDRRERRLPRYTARAQAIQLKRLAEMGAEAAISAIDWSIAQGYKGIFPPPQASCKAPAIAKSAAPSTWEIKTRLDLIDTRLRSLKSRSPGEHCSLWDFLSEAERIEYQQLTAQRKALQTQLIHA